jgi:hypothetical protein
MTKDYVTKRLDDHSRLDDVYRLTHDSLVDAGDILPQEDDQIISAPHLDRIAQTTIVIAEKNEEIVGTVSVTIDGPSGLISDNYFREETDLVRSRCNGAFCSTWRMATAKEYRGNLRLVQELILESFNIARENSCELCLFVFNERHVRVYKRLIKAEVIARKDASVDQNTQLPVVLMQMDMVQGWNTFNQRRKLA